MELANLEKGQLHNNLAQLMEVVRVEAVSS